MIKNFRLWVGAIAVSASAIVGIAGYEGYRSNAYKDIGGVPTIGYGETKGVQMGDTTTPDRALIQLLISTEKHASEIRQCIKVPLHQHEFDAYVSLAYNIGTGAFCKSTLVKKLNAGDYEGACKQILRWNKVNGKTVQGLVNRREAEYATCVGEKR